MAGGGWVIVKTAALNAMGPGRLRMTTRGQRLFGNQTVNKATIRPAAGLVIRGVLIVLVLAAKRYD